MSTFKGLFEEEQLKYIAADYFEPSVRHCHAFFLSHAHTDHMAGLNASFGQLLIENPKKKLYCSLITKELFSKLDKYCSGFDLDTLIVLDIGLPHVLSIADKYVTVTLVPAGHCPGSVMFLFEVDDIRVLFTGDFRYDAKDIGKLKLLKNPDGTVKKIDNIYLDTTFAYEEYRDFPSRDQSLQAILTEVKNWLKKDESNVVNLELPARFAYEFVFVSIYQMLNMKVHVTPAKLDLYKNISDIIGSVTSDPIAKIHACSDHAPCVRGKTKNPLTIRLCTMLFKDSFVQNCGGGLYKNCDSSEYKIFYATHSSLNELRTFVNYLTPVTVTPFVIQPGTGVNLEILRERVTKLPDKTTNISHRTTEESPTKKKLKLEYNNVLKLNLGSSKYLPSSESSSIISSHPKSTLSPLDIESPPSSPDY
uniref:Protein artemis n=1 Tax=Cacopsylla melanoneura TaxID=428564 RepID=A0A8D8Y9M6_9HEMI